jgi:hypothetical protein
MITYLNQKRKRPKTSIIFYIIIPANLYIFHEMKGRKIERPVRHRLSHCFKQISEEYIIVYIVQMKELKFQLSATYLKSQC